MLPRSPLESVDGSSVTDAHRTPTAPPILPTPPPSNDDTMGILDRGNETNGDIVRPAPAPATFPDPAVALELTSDVSLPSSLWTSSRASDCVSALTSGTATCLRPLRPALAPRHVLDRDVSTEGIRLGNLASLEREIGLCAGEGENEGGERWRVCRSIRIR